MTLPYSILIVEDEAEIADSVVYALKAEGLNTLWANSGQQALEYVKQVPTVIILDVGLPDIQGFELIKLIKKDYDIPVIFLTARSEEIDRIVGLEIGADDYVTKPFSPRELATRVKVILRRLKSASQSAATDARSTSNATNDTPHMQHMQKHNNTFVIDADKQLAYCHSQALILTRTEFILLQTLLKQTDRVFSRRQLIDAIWSSNHPSDDRVIDTHIKTLRAKIKQVDEADYIITHRGFGYSLSLV